MNSFASQVKQELSEINNLKDKSLVRSELLGYLITSERNEFTTENQYNISSLIKLGAGILLLRLISRIVGR